MSGSSNYTDAVGLLGNIIDHWELLANDIRSDPGMDNLNAAIVAARTTVEGGNREAANVAGSEGLKPNAPSATVQSETALRCPVCGTALTADAVCPPCADNRRHAGGGG